MIGWIIFTIIALIIVGGAILLIIWRMSSKYKIPPNAVLAINLNPNTSGGHALLIELPSESNIWDDRKLVKGIPLDMKYDEDGDPVLAQEQIIPMKKERRIAISPGGLSSYRTIAFYFPESFMDLPNGFRETPVGMAFAIGTEAVKMRDTLLKVIKTSNKTEAELQRDVARIESDFVKKADDMMKAFIRKESSSSMPNTSMNTGNGALTPLASQF